MKTKYDNIFINPDFYDVMFRTPIAFDLDSVMNDSTYLREYVANTFGLTMKDIMGHKDGHEVFHFEIPGVSDYDIGRVVNKCIREESPSALPSPYMKQVMLYVWCVTAQPIAVVTARHPSNCTVTKNWLDENLDGIPYRAYVMHGEKKNKVLGLLDVKIFVDDRHQTIRNLIGKIDYPVLYRQAWNQGRRDKLPAIEVRDLRDIIPLLNIQLGRMPTAWPEGLPYPNSERGDICFKS
jgi:5'(3')-deoxyribonucleotidase